MAKIDLVKNFPRPPVVANQQRTSVATYSLKKSRFIGYIDNVKIYRDLIYSMTTNATFIFGHRQADYSLLCQLPTLIPFGETEWLTKNLEYPT